LAPTPQQPTNSLALTKATLYRFILWYEGTVVLGHHIYVDIDQQAMEKAWQAWVERTFA
jgi:hypothetical protein